MTGAAGAFTVSVAVAVPPLPLLLVPIWLVVFTFAPVVTDVTVTLIWQVAPAASGPPPENARTESPAALPDVTLPPHVLENAGVEATVMPAGNGSVKLIPERLTALPAGLPTVMVITEVPPALIVVGANALVIVGDTNTFVTSEFVLLPLACAGSPPPEIDTLFVTVPTAPAPTVTVSVIALPCEFAGIDVVLVQVTTCPTALHAQPVPVPDTNPSPVGSVSVIVVVVAVDATAPMLFGVIV